MKYTVQNGIHIAAVPVSDFRILLYDAKKKSMGKNRCTGGFFGTYHEGNQAFTLPAGHLVCDYAATSAWTRHYCEERGSFNGDKFRFDSGTWKYNNALHGKAISTLVVAKGKASIQDMPHAPTDCDYSVAGVPVLRNGNDVKWASYVSGQGWEASALRATWHVFLGVKDRYADTIYVMGMKTTSKNMILTAEAYKKFKALGFQDVIKLDGGGSFYFNAGGKVTSTLENRRICSIIDMGAMEASQNPYKVPTKVLVQGNSDRTGNRWLQWELTDHGYPCDIDGYFGPGTKKQLKAYQADHGLEVDGCCGPATKASLQA